MNHKSIHTRSVATLVGLAAISLLALMLTVAGVPAMQAQAQDSSDVDANDADIIVQFGDTDVIMRPITFTTPISGVRALELAGLQFETYDFGDGFVGMCNIEGVGCPATAEDCFCWGYNYWDGASWQSYHQVGGSGSVISQTGAIEGWRWGEFDDPMIPAPQVQTAESALDWLRNTQTEDGGFGNSGGTVETMIAMGANRLKATDWVTGSNKSFMDHWAVDDIEDDGYANNAAKYASISAASNGKLMVAAAGTGEDVHNFADVDLSNSLMDHYTMDSGVFGENNWDQAFGMLGWRVAYTTSVPSQAVEVLASRVISDGGWGWAPTVASDTNTTAVIVQALRAADQCTQRSLVANAIDYLRMTQNDDGGFPYDAGGDSDPNSTALAIQAILAVGEDPGSAAWTRDGNTPVDFLQSRQLADGSLEWQIGDGGNALATQQAVLPTLNGLFPIRTEGVNCGAIFLPMVNK